ncbi:hypothetical protein N7454_005510 [Penicillium verhagenii]|nr:hypothetical protein N7454_005510 [Penicillium verhagenii]
MVPGPQECGAVDTDDNCDHTIVVDGVTKPPLDLLNLAAQRGITIKTHDLTEPAFDIRTANATTCGTVMDMLVADAREALEIIEWPTKSAKRKKTTGVSVLKRSTNTDESSTVP